MVKVEDVAPAASRDGFTAFPEEPLTHPGGAATKAKAHIPAPNLKVRPATAAGGQVVTIVHEGPNRLRHGHDLVGEWLAIRACLAPLLFHIGCNEKRAEAISKGCIHADKNNGRCGEWKQAFLSNENHDIVSRPQ